MIIANIQQAAGEQWPSAGPHSHMVLRERHGANGKTTFTPIILKSWKSRAVAFAITILLSSGQAQAFVGYTRCLNSNEVAGAGEARLPQLLTRIDVHIDNGKETVLSPTWATTDGRDSNIIARIARRPPALRNASETTDWEALRNRPEPIIRDGRYVILTTRYQYTQTDANKERKRDCDGKVNTLIRTLSEVRKKGKIDGISTQLSNGIGYIRCDERCPNLSNAELIDAFFLPHRRRRLMIRGFENFSIQWPSPGRDISFLVPSHDTFRPDRFARERRGGDARWFHPEIFNADVTLREMKPGIVDPYLMTPLVVAVHSVAPCPTGDTAMTCAPEETRSRAARVRYPPEIRCGTSCMSGMPRQSSEAIHSIKDDRKVRAPTSCKTDEECLDIYLRLRWQATIGGSLLATALIGVVGYLIRRRRHSLRMSG